MSTKRIWGGRIFTAVVTVALLGSAIGKLVGAPKMVDGLTHAGIPREAIVPIAALELACLFLYLAPRTKVLGTLLLTGYFGGAIVTHIIGRESVFPPLFIGILIWNGGILSVPELGYLVPVRREAQPAAPAPDPESPRGVTWIYRVVLAAAAFIFTMIGMRYVADPVHAAAATGVTLGSAFATTTTRIGFGAFPLGFAIFSFVCLF